MARDTPDRAGQEADANERDVYGGPQRSDWRKYVKPSLWGVLAVFTIVFISSNLQDTTISFVVFQMQTKLVWVLVFCVLLGVGLAEGFRFWRRRRAGLRRAESK